MRPGAHIPVRTDEARRDQVSINFNLRFQRRSAISGRVAVFFFGPGTGSHDGPVALLGCHS